MMMLLTFILGAAGVAPPQDPWDAASALIRERVATMLKRVGLPGAEGKRIDQLSGGRAVLGIGGAWFEREHDAFGIDYHIVIDNDGRAAKQQRISQGRALNDLTRPLVVPRKLRANSEVCPALSQ